MRVATGALSHETSTFTPVPTTRESYEARQGFLRGDEILTHFRGANAHRRLYRRGRRPWLRADSDYLRRAAPQRTDAAGAIRRDSR